MVIGGGGSKRWLENVPVVSRLCVCMCDCVSVSWGICHGRGGGFRLLSVPSVLSGFPVSWVLFPLSFLLGGDIKCRCTPGWVCVPLAYSAQPWLHLC